MRAVPYRIEAFEHRHGVQVCDRKPDLAKDDRQAETEVAGCKETWYFLAFGHRGHRRRLFRNEAMIGSSPV